MNRSFFNDIIGLCRGLELVVKESVKYQKTTLDRVWDNSSVRTLIEEQAQIYQKKLQGITPDDISHAVKESYERLSMVAHGIKVYASTSYAQDKHKFKEKKVEKSYSQNAAEPDLMNLPKGVSPEDLKVSELHYKDKELIAKLEREFELLKKAELEKQKQTFSNHTLPKTKDEVKKLHDVEEENRSKKIEQPVVKKYVPKIQELNPEAKQRKVPSSRIGRMISFGSLAAGLGVGALAEVTRRTLGLSEKLEKPPTLDQLFLTEANAERIVNTLCKVRGAALKIGQILSIQDNTVISPVLQKAFERVRQSADFMPSWQVQKVLIKELGHNWRDKVSYFEEKPFAAASIGQVHRIRLKDGRECAMKIQYPGVAKGIESDINNLVGVFKIWNVFPKGLFIDNLVEVAKRELAWEVDYKREAECTRKFSALLAPYPDYVVPEVIGRCHYPQSALDFNLTRQIVQRAQYDELSTNEIFTSTLVEGVPVDQCVNLEDEHRERIAKLIMQLCLREIFEFRYMQTDPNWSNFFYDPNTRKVSLLDFGASRSYEVEFVKKYIEVIKAASDGNRDKVLKISQEMGFLTGYESKSMENAHVNAVMILAEVFSSEKAFDFGRQDTTLRIQKLVPVIVAERLCPPPEEIYSLHRKLSGVFLLCAKLKVKISCRDMFLQVYKKFKEETR